MIRLIACDVDGTLIGHDGALPPERTAAVGRLVEAGLVVVLATGKIWSSIRPIWEELQLPGPHIACNGAAVVDADGRLLECTPLPTRTAMTIVDELRRRQVPHAVYLDDGSLVTEARVPALDILPRLGEPDPIEGSVAEAIEGRQVLKVLSVLSAQDEAGLRDLAAGQAKIQRTSHRFLEWNHPDADKALGLRFVAKHLGISMQDVAAIGDAENDVPMLLAAGTGVAVSDASDAALNGADLHLESDLATYFDAVAAAARRP